jgi:hypothetical protein
VSETSGTTAAAMLRWLPARCSCLAMDLASLAPPAHRRKAVGRFEAVARIAEADE